MRLRLTAEPPPRLWIGFCHHQLRLDADRAARWWKALQAATSRRAVAVYSAVQSRAALGLAQGSLEHFVLDLVHPRVLVEALDDLVQEGWLPAQMAYALQDVVLSQTDATGAWRHGVRRPCIGAPDMP
jgi:hypothetical protein